MGKKRPIQEVATVRLCFFCKKPIEPMGDAIAIPFDRGRSGPIWSHPHHTGVEQYLKQQRESQQDT